MRTLSAIRDTVRQLLNDEFLQGTQQDFQDDELNLQIGHCLGEISEKRPYEVKVTSDDDDADLVTTAGSLELDISNISDLIKVEKAEFPVGNEPPNYRNVSVFGNTLRFKYDSIPAGGQDIYLYCWKLHQLNEETSTLNPQLERVLIDGTVAYAALAWANQARKQIASAISGIPDAKSAIDAISSRIDKAIADLVEGREYIGVKLTEAINAVDSMSDRITQSVDDLTSGRTKIGDKRTEAIAALDAIAAEITKSLDDLNIGRAQIDDARTNANTSIDDMLERITQSIGDLTTGRTFINKVNVGGRPETDYANYASRELSNAVTYLNQARGYLGEGVTADRYQMYAARELQAANTLIGQARGYMALDVETSEHANYAARELSNANALLSQARGYLAMDAESAQYANYAARELSNATAYLNQAGGYMRQITSRLNIAGAINAYQNWANNKLSLYKADLRGITKQRISQLYPTS